MAIKTASPARKSFDAFWAEQVADDPRLSELYPDMMFLIFCAGRESLGIHPPMPDRQRLIFNLTDEQATAIGKAFLIAPLSAGKFFAEETLSLIVREWTDSKMHTFQANHDDPTDPHAERCIKCGQNIRYEAHR